MDDKLMQSVAGKDKQCNHLDQRPKCTPITHKTIMTHKSAMVFGLGSSITNEDLEITGSRLPTGRQVLRCLMYHVQEGATRNRTKWESAKYILSKVSVFYEKANIPMVADRYACSKIIKLMEDNAKIRAIPHARRLLPATLSKVKKHEKKLDETFPLWPKNVEKLIDNVEDQKFLQSMRSDRLATFGSKDKVCGAKLQRWLKRQKAESSRRERMLREITASSTIVKSSCVTDSDSDTAINNDMSMGDSNVDSTCESISETSVPSNSSLRSHHRTIRCGTKVFIPHDILKHPKLVALATRMKMTPAQQAAYTKALIAESGGDISLISASYSTADRSRCKVGDEIANVCREEWVVPKFLTLHWDSKLLPTLQNPNINEERLTIVVGNKDELKLLGVPSYKLGSDRKSGQIIAELTSKLLKLWHCADNIVNMTFDTTALNTGHLTAACVKIQQELKRAILWSGCRHHIGEVILSHIFNDLQIEVSKSPEVTLFKRFRKNFDLMPRSSDTPLSRFDLTPFSNTAQTFLTDCRDNVLRLTRLKLSMHRDDYLEFIELCTVFLEPDGEVAENPIIFKRPGALHKARWMAKLLYSVKIVLFEQYIQNLPPGAVSSQQQVSKLRDFVIFVTIIYSSWWMTASSAVDAPWHDLKLYHHMLCYEAVNALVSRSALSAFKNHLWYLTAEMVPLALFSNETPAEARGALANSLISMKPDSSQSTPKERFGTGFGKPKFPSNINLSTTLADLVTPDSWFIFDILHLDPDFLSKDVAEWPQTLAYQTSAENARAVNVINDCAERGVKLSADFLTAAKSEKHYQNVLQVVEKDRKQNPNLRKRLAKNL